MKTRFTVLTQGPDNNSTYAECWGAAATSRGQHYADVPSLRALVEAIHDLGHANYTVRDRLRHVTHNGPALATIAALEAKSV